MCRRTSSVSAAMACFYVQTRTCCGEPGRIRSNSLKSPPLNTDATGLSETLVPTYQTTRSHISEDMYLCGIFAGVTTWVREAEESPQLEAVATERLMKTQQDGNRPSGCCSNLWIVEISAVIKRSSECCTQVVNKTIHQYPVYSHTPKSWQYLASHRSFWQRKLQSR
jgi:hypothetical protein